MRANYVANMYVNAVRLNMEWDENYFPTDMVNIFTGYEDIENYEDDVESVDYDDISDSSDCEI